MNLKDYNNIYFLGIGGIGMSALARWFKHTGLRVAGYDRTATPLTQDLAEEGMEIHFEDKVEFIPGYLAKENTLVVYTPAIPKDHKEYHYLKEQGFTIVKRSEVLGMLTKNYKTVAVAGTHGKTTTSSLIAHIIKSARKDMVAFLGGITSNYESNLVMNGKVNEHTIMVAEADEFDRSFLRLFPEMAVVTSADADHLDIYGDHLQMLSAYKEFIHQVNKGGYLVIHESIAVLANEKKQITIETYGTTRGQFFASNIKTQHGFFEFDLNGPGLKIENIQLGVPGFHNMENAIAASMIAMKLGIEDSVIKQALASFNGVKRRFEFIIRSEKNIFIDDYAHHPTEIEAFLKSLKSMYPEKKITVVFQPHLFTRTRDFAEGFSKSLSLADELLLLDIYPAREQPIPGITSDMLFKDITSPVKIRCTKKDVIQKLDALNIEVLATVGAGDIDTLVKPIKEMLKRK
ncbi:MAG: UDP-N-acetylmuramate--L-alanine ligase [Cytophagales bacterium]|jgi:UDP-N-acetylmuramate--alanine ligase|nr:UDP-N-acetylmuramate--L-alanine ligase [Bacteroidota bacterium]MBS1980628.1 UDP-N-acetylmuramate--L-alanine ligase [Bacteroidota bacterium]WHZ07951.1 MAG: UDP-N-acetylmuramate--L-alanine ligase [Cytophagales bacterium]